MHGSPFLCYDCMTVPCRLYTLMHEQALLQQRNHRLFKKSKKDSNTKPQRNLYQPTPSPSASPHSRLTRFTH